MNIFIYDDFVTEKKFRTALNKIEIRITDLGLSGKIIRLESIKNVDNIISGEINRGAKTLIAVGNNSTVSKIIRSFNLVSKNLESKFVLGIIPLGEKNNSIARSLGISDYEEACDILLARRIKCFDLGTANGEPFLSHASISTNHSSIEIDGDYSINIINPGTINIINLSTFLDLPINIKPDPGDGKLELYISTKNKSLLKKSTYQKSFFPFEKLRVLNKKLPLTIDESREVGCPVNIGIKKNFLNIIIGKQRNFT